MTTTPWADQRTPALALLARGDQLSARSPNEYTVRSQSRPEVTYRVRAERGRWACDCPFFAETRLACLHQVAVRLFLGFQEKPAPPIETVPACVRCHGGPVVKIGVRVNRSGRVRRFRCRGCGGSFTGREGYHRRRADPEIISKALDLYFRGVSLRQVAEHFGQAYDLKLSPTTVYRWITHYSALAAEWMNAQGAKVGETWHVDERVVNINGENRYLWNVMDSDTRFLLASRISKGRGVPEARAAFKQAKRATVVRPQEIRSDGLGAYPPAISKEFGRRLKGKVARQAGIAYFTPHVVVPSIRAPNSNNILERLNGTSKDRTKTMRAYDNLTGASSLSVGWQVHYNLIRDHLALGKTPGEAAGLPHIDGFRWRTLIDLAVRRNETVSPAPPS